ncbi:MAG: chemotaxis protein CheX [Desulfarculaceae bacterium]|jgi:hypothetical protein
MEETWTKALRDSISEAFSTMFFMVPEEDSEILEEIKNSSTEGWTEGWVEVSRPEQSVRFWVWAPSDVARELAANILSSEPDEVSSEDILDAYGEMLNIVVGSVLTIVDDKGEWKMGLPHAEPVPQQTLGEAVNQTQQSISFDVEGKPLLVGWHIQGK